ncbi:MAG: hypothetical protein ACSLE5_07400 [Porticoccaceae bacterium]
MTTPVKFWQRYDSWADAEKAWDARADGLAEQLPLKTFKKNPNLPGIRRNTRRFLPWKSLSYLHRHDHSGKLRRYFWRHPLRHGIGLVKNLLRGQSYRRDGDFFLYDIADVAEFVHRLEQPNAVLVVGFSYCHKPFECPAGRFTDQCIHDQSSPVCGQCFIGKAVHSLPEVRVIPLFITTVHYIGEKMIEARAAWPGRDVLFLITACELTLEMFGLVGCAVGLEGVGVRLDGQICNTMKAFAASEIGIKPGMAIVTEPTQARMMAIFRAFAQAAGADPGAVRTGVGERPEIIASDRCPRA